MASENSRRINQPNLLCICAQMWLIDFEAQLPLPKSNQPSSVLHIHMHSLILLVFSTTLPNTHIRFSIL